jgi:hypothetical protein
MHHLRREDIPAMTQHEFHSSHTKRQVAASVEQASPWIERLGRLGYAAKGLVYVLVGVLAAQAAFTTGGQTTDSRGALQQIVQAPFGRVLLAIVAVGLVGYALWRFVQAGMDTENKGTDTKGILTRGAYAIVGLLYLGLAFSAVRMIMGSSDSGGGDAATQGWTARLMSQPFGQLLVGLVGAGVVGFGLYQLYQAYSAKFREKLKLGEMSPTEETWTERLGRFGYGARGIVFTMIGAFLIVAAIQAQPEQARGLGGALATLSQQPYGPWLLGAVAIGLVAYGVFMLAEARYRRMIIS